jgi:hypothetical protein
LSGLVVAEERGALGVGNGRLAATPLEFLASEGRHDGKSKDPLQGNDLALELCGTESGREHGEPDAHGVVLVDDEEEGAVDEDRPDEDVGKDACDQRVGAVHHDGAVPVDGHECPGQRARDGGCVDETRIRVVAEVERGQVKEVDDQDELGPAKVRADEEHDEGEVQQVVQDEVAANRGGGIDLDRVLGEEIGDVADLKYEENDPILQSSVTLLL